MVITKNFGIILSIRSATIFSTNRSCEFYFQNTVQIHPILSITPHFLGSGHRTGKVSLHSNSKEGNCQRMFKLLCKCSHFTCQQSYAQNPSSQDSVVCQLRSSTCTCWIQKRQRNQRSNWQYLLDHRESKGISTNIYFSFIDYTKTFDCVDHKKLENLRYRNSKPPYLSPEKSVYGSRSNSQNLT